MKQTDIHPFANECATVQIGELTVENRVDRVSLYGSLDLTLDKQGLAFARYLKAILGDILTELEKADLPDHIAKTKPETVDNPFE